MNEKKFPYNIRIEPLGADVTLNIQIRIFPPNIVALTVSLSGFHSAIDPKLIIDYQRIDHLHPIIDIARLTVSMAESLSHKGISPSQSIRYEPAIHLEGIASAEDFAATIKSDINKYIGILIRNYEYELMDSDIIDRIIDKNREHNKKLSQELLLLDKQGLLLLTPSQPRDKRSIVRRFIRSHDLCELAVVFSLFLKNYPSLRTRQEDMADFLLYKVQHWIYEPDNIFSESVTNGYIWKLLINDIKLRSSLQMIMRPYIVAALEDKSRYFDQFALNWWEDKDFSSILSRKLAEFTQLDLSFLDDDELKALIFSDYAEAKSSLQSRNYKATVLLCGSIAEAILTSVIAKANIPGLSKDVLCSSYALAKLIEVAKDNRLLKDVNLFSLLDPLRSYRNAIHPGVTIRKSITLDLPTAKIALEVVHLLCKDLMRSKRH